MQEHKILCDTVIQDATDYAFDQLEHSAVIDKNYDKQFVVVRVEEMGETDNIIRMLYNSSFEKITDMLFEARNGYDVGYAEDELYELKNTLDSAEFTVE